MNILGKFTALAALALATTSFGSCDSMFHDDLADCPQGVYVRFYQQKDKLCFAPKVLPDGKSLDVKPSFAPIGKVNNLYVLAFDKNTGLLANFVAADKDVNLTHEHETFVPLTKGDYELVAWSGNAENFAAANLQKGVTKKSDTFFQLRQQQDGSIVFPNTPEPLRFGFAGTGNQRQPANEQEYAAQQNGNFIIDEAINIPDPAKFGSVFRHAAINLREQALNVRLQIVVDNSVNKSKHPTTADKFSAKLFTKGTSLSNEPVKNGLLPAWDSPQAALVKSEKLQAVHPIATSLSGDTLKIDYRLLGNSFNSLADGRLELSHAGTSVENAPDFNPDLAPTKTTLSLAGLLLEAIKANQISLNCSSDVTVTLHVRNACLDCDTYMIFAIEIAKWGVHSHEVII